MPDKRGTAETAPRWLMVSLSREQLKEIERRTRAEIAADQEARGPHAPTRLWGVDRTATKLLTWALEHAPEPLP